MPEQSRDALDGNVVEQDLDGESTAETMPMAVGVSFDPMDALPVRIPRTTAAPLNIVDDRIPDKVARKSLICFQTLLNSVCEAAFRVVPPGRPD
jgi:hypothetical protein